MSTQNAHALLDDLLKDSKISGSAYLTLRQAITENTPHRRPRSAEAPRTGFGQLTRGLALNYLALCLAFGVLACTVAALQGFPISAGEMFVYYFVIQPIAIAIYHILFLPIGEALYRLISRVAPVTRLPVYAVTAWVLLMPALMLIPPIR